MKVILNVDRNIAPNRKKAGDVVELHDEIALRWIEAGIARPEMETGTAEHTEIEHPKVSIIILVKDALPYFKKCIESIIKYTHNYELIIVDNDSKKETKDYIKSLDINYTLITNDENKGFSYGNNQGIKVAKSDYICFLNSDTVVTPNWIGLLMKGLELPEAGAVGPSTCFCSGKQMLRAYTRYRGKDMPYPVNPPEGYEEFIYPDYLIGFCVLVKKEVLDKIGGFDHHSFPLILGEDVDFSVRVARAGYKLYWVKNCYIHHYGHASIYEAQLDANKISMNTRPALKANIDSNKIKIDNDVEIKNIDYITNRVVYTANIGDHDNIIEWDKLEHGIYFTDMAN